MRSLQRRLGFPEHHAAAWGLLEPHPRRTLAISALAIDSDRFAGLANNPHT
jgi:hypothetical protein